MQTVSKRIELDYGHTLPDHYSFCSQIHGHRGVVVATVEGAIIEKQGDSSQGMIVDFGILKKIMMEEVHAKLDHGFAVWKHDTQDLEFIIKRNKKYLITDMPPTAEYLSMWAHNQIKNKLPSMLYLVKTEWYETPSSKATYFEVKKNG